MIETGHLLCHIMDVDMHGSGILIQTQTHNILIDLAFEKGTDNIVRYLKNQNVSRLDLVVITHPHRDHMAGQGAGGLAKFLNNFEIKEVWSNGMPLPTWYGTSSQCPDGPNSPEDYDAYLSLIFPDGYVVGGQYDELPIIKGQAPDIIYKEPRAGDVFQFGETTFNILHPGVPINNLNANPHSIVIQVEHKGRRLMLTGDALSSSESDIMDRYTQSQLKSDLLYLGHHGIDDATSETWFNTVDPSMVTVQRRDRDSARIWNMITAKNIPIYDPYQGEPWPNYDDSNFVNYVFDVHEEGIDVTTFKMSPIRKATLVMNNDGLLRKAMPVINNNGLIVEADVVINVK